MNCIIKLMPLVAVLYAPLTLAQLPPPAVEEAPAKLALEQTQYWLAQHYRALGK